MNHIDYDARYAIKLCRFCGGAGKVRRTDDPRLYKPCAVCCGTGETNPEQRRAA